MGEPPPCLGAYVVGDAQCDGVPCRWRSQCAVYTKRSELLSIDPEKEKALLGGNLEPLYPMIRALLSVVPKDYEDRRLHRLAWQRFCDALSEELPADRILATSVDLALPGDLFVGWKTKGRERGSASWAKGGPSAYTATLPYFYSVGLKVVPGGKRESYTLIRFYPRPFKVVEVSVALRIGINELLARRPETERTCRRMRGDHDKARFARDPGMKTLLVRVLPDRLEDVGRLCGALIRERAFNDVPARAWNA